MVEPLTLGDFLTMGGCLPTGDFMVIVPPPGGEYNAKIIFGGSQTPGGPFLDSPPSFERVLMLTDDMVQLKGVVPGDVSTTVVVALGDVPTVLVSLVAA